MTMADDESDLVEVEEEEIEASVKERTYELAGTEVELEDVEGEEEDEVTGDRENLVNLLVEMNENNPVDIEFPDEEGDEVEEEEIEPVSKGRDPSNDLIFSDSMRDRSELIGEDEWEAVDPAEGGDGE